MIPGLQLDGFFGITGFRKAKDASTGRQLDDFSFRAHQQRRVVTCVAIAKPPLRAVKYAVYERNKPSIQVQLADGGIEPAAEIRWGRHFLDQWFGGSVQKVAAVSIDRVVAIKQ
jgi:hypothetical protein